MAGVGGISIFDCNSCRLFYGTGFSPDPCAAYCGASAPAPTYTPPPTALGGGSPPAPTTIRASSGCGSCGKQAAATAGTPTGPAGTAAKPAGRAVPWWFWVIVLLGLAQVVYGKDAPLLA
jgi:hypothetical protein